MNGRHSPMRCIKLPAANACIFKRIEGPSNALSFGLPSIYRKRTRFPEAKWVSGCTGDSDYKFPFVAGKRNVVRSDARVSEENGRKPRDYVIPFLTRDTFPRDEIITRCEIRATARHFKRRRG